MFGIGNIIDVGSDSFPRTLEQLLVFMALRVGIGFLHRLTSIFGCWMAFVCWIELSWAKTELATRVAAQNTRRNVVDIIDVIFRYPIIACSMYSRSQMNVVDVKE